MSTSLFRTVLARGASVTVLAAAALAGTPAVAQAGPAGSVKATIRLANNSTYELSLSDKDVDEGTWWKKPLGTVASGEKARFGTQSDVMDGGTEGSATYDTDAGEIEISWYVPGMPGEESTFECDRPEGLYCSVGWWDPYAAKPSVTVTVYE